MGKTREIDGEQCARCGSSVEFVHCWNCGGEGYSHHACGEDSCCCLYPEDNVQCDACRGAGGHWECLSAADWCIANPLPGRENTPRGEIECYTVTIPVSEDARDGE